MKQQLTAIAMAGVLMGTFILAPITSVVAGQASKKLLVAERPTSKALQNLPVTGTLSDGTALSGGNLTITKFGYDQTNKKLLVSGVLTYGSQSTGGEATTLTQTFTDVPTTLTKSSGQQKQVGTCDILFLDLGPIFLDVLGLTVDLSEITLDINAVAGPGNLLGNLLCALVNLLNGGPLAAILELINQINAILSSL
jgi:hypothetical protein